MLDQMIKRSKREKSVRAVFALHSVCRGGDPQPSTCTAAAIGRRSIRFGRARQTEVVRRHGLGSNSAIRVAATGAKGANAAGSAKSRAGAGITKQLSRFANFVGCLATRPGGGGSQKKRSKRSTAKSSSGSDA